MPSSRTLCVAAVLAGLSACCKSGPGITNVSFDCTTLADWCTPGADAGAEDGGGACADHTACNQVEKSDPDFGTVSANNATCYKCYFQPRSCKSTAQCCPGQQCNTSLSLCFDCYNLQNGQCGSSDCTNDADCVNLEGPGHVCVLFNSPDGGQPQIANDPDDSAPTRRCSYPTCKSDADCTGGTSCFPAGAKPYGYCVSQPPCSGPCATGFACTVTDDLCSEVPADKPACQQSCPPGNMLVFVDESVPTGVYDACNLPAVDCDCAVLPPLVSNDLGRYSSLQAKSGQIWVSAYDGQYGDLVAYRYAPDGGLIALEYVDGVPDGGQVVADPTGPRGGIATPGPDVGEWTSLTLGADGEPRISYYDIDHKSLKFAQRQSSGSWTIEWVDGWDGAGADGGGGDVGTYTSIALDPSGNPAIAYFQAAGPSTTNALATAVKLARATKANPTGPADWTITVVDGANKPAPPCFPATCKSGQTCVGSPPVTDGGPIQLSDGGCEPYAPPDNGGTCMANSTRCGSGDAGGCASGTACVASDGGAPSCQPTYTAESFNDLPEGIGLFTSLAFDPAGSPVVAYYDRLHGDLRVAVGTGSGFTVTTVDGTDPATCEDTGDVGYFPSLQVGTGNLAVAYQDGTDEDLLYWTGAVPAAIAPSQRVVVDTGTLQPPNPPDGGPEDVPQFAGANVSLRFGASGKAYFAYQNQTQISLRLASEPAGCGTQTPSSCTPTVINEWAAAPEGFYAQVSIDGTSGWLSSAQIKALTGGVDNLLLLEGPVTLP